ncbi:MAG: ligase-associated DNA damage response endonuclease PdeM [Proteobacteria bacterium]|nr:ligase-associated DNA damage response endonuclease PdeM [Pseudomonadota bacterium]
MRIAAGGRPLTLLPEGAIWLDDRKTLLIADAHIGKAATFRRLGVPVPRGTTSETLGRLERLVAQWGARRVVFLGDLLHSRAAFAEPTQDAFTAWRMRHAALDLVLVRGNHDRRAGRLPDALAIEVVAEPWVEDGLALCHHPEPCAEGYVLAGHLHPCVVLHGRAGDRLRLPCFHFGAAVGVLPAFGAFTGMHPIAPAPGDRVYAIAEDGVFALPTSP